MLKKNPRRKNQRGIVMSKQPIKKVISNRGQDKTFFLIRTNVSYIFYKNKFQFRASIMIDCLSLNSITFAA